MLCRMQKALLSATLNIARTFKFVTLKDNHKAPDATDFRDLFYDPVLSLNFNFCNNHLGMFLFIYFSFPSSLFPFHFIAHKLRSCALCC